MTHQIINGIFETNNHIINGVIGMAAALTYFGIRRGIHAYRGRGVHKWVCPSCSFKVEASHAVIIERVKANHLRGSHDVHEEEGA